MAKTRLTLVLFGAATVFFLVSAVLQFVLGNVLLGGIFGVVTLVGATMTILVLRGRIM